MGRIFPFLGAHLVDDPAGDTHSVENGHVDDGGHPSVVDGLRAVRPHVRRLRQVDVAGRKAGGRREVKIMITMTRVVPIARQNVMTSPHLA